MGSAVAIHPSAVSAVPVVQDIMSLLRSDLGVPAGDQLSFLHQIVFLASPNGEISAGYGELAAFIGTLDAQQTSGARWWYGGFGGVNRTTEGTCVSPGNSGSAAGRTSRFASRSKIQDSGYQQEKTHQDE